MAKISLTIKIESILITDLAYKVLLHCFNTLIKTI